MELVIHRDKLESSTEREKGKRKRKEMKEWSRKERNVWKRKQGKARPAKMQGENVVQ